MRAPTRSSLRRRRRGLLIALAMTVAAVVGYSTGAVATPPAAGVTKRVGSVTEYTLGDLVITGKGSSRTSTVGNGGSLVLGGAWHVSWWGDRAPARYSLQRKIGTGAWTTTKATVATTDDGLRTRTPAWSTKATKTTVKYRLVSSAYSDAATGGVRNTSRSQVVKVVYENQKRYTGLAKAIWDDAKAYCPNTAVHVTGLSDGNAGDYQTGTLLIRAVPDLASYDALNLRAVALHECSHQRQWLNYGGTNSGHDRMETAAGRIFSDWVKPADVTVPYRYDDPADSITPVEHAADCGAQALNPGGYLGYGGYCTDAQLKAGKRLLLGHKY